MNEPAIASQPSLGGSGTLLLHQAATPGDKESYRRALATFLLFCDVLGLTLNSVIEIDQAMCAYFDECHLEGLGASTGDLVICAWCDLFPQFRPGAFLFSWRAIRAWRRLRPPQGRHPMPWIVACGIAVHMAHNTSPLLAIGFLMMYGLYLRPYQLLNVRISDILKPTMGFLHFMLIVCPLTSKKPSKTKVCDDGVAFDGLLRPQLRALVPLLLDQKLWNPTDKPFTFNNVALSTAIKSACSWLGLDTFESTAYHCRHGGPSEDYAFQGRCMADIQKRGRWASACSLKRYEQCNRLHVVLNACVSVCLSVCLSVCVEVCVCVCVCV